MIPKDWNGKSGGGRTPSGCLPAASSTMLPDIDAGPCSTVRRSGRCFNADGEQLEIMLVCNSGRTCLLLTFPFEIHQGRTKTVCHLWQVPLVAPFQQGLQAHDHRFQALHPVPYKLPKGVLILPQSQKGRGQTNRRHKKSAPQAIQIPPPL